MNLEHKLAAEYTDEVFEYNYKLFITTLVKMYKYKGKDAFQSQADQLQLVQMLQQVLSPSEANVQQALNVAKVRL